MTQSMSSSLQFNFEPLPSPRDDDLPSSGVLANLQRGLHGHPLLDDDPSMPVQPEPPLPPPEDDEYSEPRRWAIFGNDLIDYCNDQKMLDGSPEKAAARKEQAAAASGEALTEEKTSTADTAAKTSDTTAAVLTDASGYDQKKVAKARAELLKRAKIARRTWPYEGAPCLYMDGRGASGSASAVALETVSPWTPAFLCVVQGGTFPVQVGLLWSKLGPHQRPHADSWVAGKAKAMTKEAQWKVRKNVPKAELEAAQKRHLEASVVYRRRKEAQHKGDDEAFSTEYTAAGVFQEGGEFASTEMFVVLKKWEGDLQSGEYSSPRGEFSLAFDKNWWDTHDMDAQMKEPCEDDGVDWQTLRERAAASGMGSAPPPVQTDEMWCSIM